MLKHGLIVGRANTVPTAQTTLLCNLYKEIVTLSLLGVIRKEENFYAITYCTFMNAENNDQLIQGCAQNVIPLIVHITHFFITKAFDIWYRINPHRLENFS
jgi:competence protein ComGF